MTTGEKLRAWRAKRGISQASAAALVGTTQRTWGQWESDGTTPEIDYCDAIEKLTSGAVTMKDWARSRRKQRRGDSCPPSAKAS